MAPDHKIESDRRKTIAIMAGATYRLDRRNNLEIHSCRNPTALRALALGQCQPTKRAGLCPSWPRRVERARRSRRIAHTYRSLAGIPGGRESWSPDRVLPRNMILGGLVAIDGGNGLPEQACLAGEVDGQRLADGNVEQAFPSEEPK